MSYNFKLSAFEGPLDLLLHLISQAKIEIKDIFVSEITAQYLRYMEDCDTTDLDMMSEFLQMAATLVYIKSRSVLPYLRSEDEDDSLEEKLVQRLYEYKLHKESAEHLRELAESVKGEFSKYPEELLPENVGNVFINADVQGLYTAFLSLLKQARRLEEKNRPGEFNIGLDQYSVQTQLKVIIGRLAIKEKLDFSELFSGVPGRLEIVATFAALLELLAQNRVGVRQRQLFGNIEVYRKYV